MQEHTHHSIPRAPFDRRGVQGRRIVERRDGNDPRQKADRRNKTIPLNLIERRAQETRRTVFERRNKDLRVALRRDIPERRH